MRDKFPKLMLAPIGSIINASRKTVNPSIDTRLCFKAPFESMNPILNPDRKNFTHANEKQTKYANFLPDSDAVYLSFMHGTA